jgi:hypothetical protein
MVEPKYRWGVRETSILFFDENKYYPEALKLFSSVERDLEPSLLLAHARCLFHCGQFPWALEVLRTAESKRWVLPEVFLLKGRCLYMLEEYDSARLAFEMSDRCGPDSETRRWIRRCVLQLELAKPGSPRIVRIERDLPPTGRIKHEWHQTTTHLTLSLFVRNLHELQLRIEFAAYAIRVLVDDKEPLELSVKLTRPIALQDPAITVTPMKAELKFAKSPTALHQWTDIEAGA